MKKIVVVIILWAILGSCNQELYPSIYSENFKRQVYDSALKFYTVYRYEELVSHERHDKKFWVFGKDSVKYFQIFEQQLKDYLGKSKNIQRVDNTITTHSALDSCFTFLSRGAVDSFERFISEDSILSELLNNTVILKIDFKMNKETGTSGLGPMGDFSPFGSYYMYLLKVRANRLICYKSMLRRASFFNRFYTPKRSRNAIRAFFRRN